MVLLPMTSWAQIQLGDDIQLSGFGTVSAAKSDNSTPVLFSRNITDEWCFDCDTTFGAQLDWQVTANIRTTVQVLKRPQDTFSNPELERAHIEFAYDNLRFKAGRLRIPLYIMSEYYYVSSAYPWLRLPPEVYANNLGITHYEGATLDWEIQLNDELQLTFSPYISVPEKERYELYGADFTLDTDYAFGFSSELYFDENFIHLAYSRVSTEQEGLVTGDVDYNLNFFSIGLSYYIGDALHFQAETLLEKELSSNWYAGFDYRIGQFTPYVQYGQARKGKDSQSYLIGLRYDLHPQINVSAEWQRIEGDKKMISGEFTELQNPMKPFASKVDLVSVGLSFTF
tara:strand:- start:3981 stop:5003 length:1023 start_codon:yes stop_codon:yes gene_type:complete